MNDILAILSGGAADAQFLGQLVVVQFIPGFGLHGDDPAADGLVGDLPRTS